MPSSRLHFQPSYCLAGVRLGGRQACTRQAVGWLMAGSRMPCISLRASDPGAHVTLKPFTMPHSWRKPAVTAV